jgi:hypothetical protein
MSISKAILLSLAVLFSRPEIHGQTANRPHSVLFSRQTPESAARTERVRELLVEGWQLKPADALQLETRLAKDPDNVPLRLRLMSYYAQNLIAGAHATHLLWLIAHHPAEDVLQDGSAVVRLQPSPAFDQEMVLWTQQAGRFSADPRVLRNAASALFGTDPITAIQYVKAARTADPGSPEWTAWLAKIYASAVRWTNWDGAAMMTFTGNEQDFRYAVPFTLPLELCQSAKAEIEASKDAGLLEGVGEAIVREVSLLDERRKSDASILTSELPQFRQFGQRLIDRAKALRAKP